MLALPRLELSTKESVSLGLRPAQANFRSVGVELLPTPIEQTKLLWKRLCEDVLVPIPPSCLNGDMFPCQLHSVHTRQAGLSSWVKPSETEAFSMLFMAFIMARQWLQMLPVLHLVKAPMKLP